MLRRDILTVPDEPVQMPESSSAGKCATGTHSLTSNFGWMLTANAVYAVCQWGMLVGLAKIGNSFTVGQFTLGLAIATPVFTLTNMQLRSIQATDAQQQYSTGHYLAVRCITTLLGSLIIVALLAQAGYRADTTAVILCIALAKAIESISDVFYGLFQHHEQLQLVAQSMMIRGLVSVSVLSAMLHLTSSIMYAVSAMAAGWLLQLLLFDSVQAWKLLRRYDPNASLTSLLPDWSNKHQLALLRIAWPLGVVSMLISLNMNMPRYFVQHHLGEEQLGVFAALSYLSLTVITVADSLGHSAAPRLARLYHAGDRTGYRHLISQLAMVGVALASTGVLVAWLAGRPLLTLLYRPEYANQARNLTELMIAIAMACVASLLTYGITAARQFAVQILMFGSAALAAAIASYFLVPRFGLDGAAHAVVAGSLVHLVAAIYILRRELNNCGKTDKAQAKASSASNGAA